MLRHVVSVSSVGQSIRLLTERSPVRTGYGEYLVFNKISTFIKNESQ